MTSAAYIVADFICPTIGAILATLAFCAPLRSLRLSLHRGSLGELNPTPWAFMLGNCLGWVAYSYIDYDLFVFIANAPGLFIAIYLNASALKLQYHERMSSSMTNAIEGNNGTNNENSSDSIENEEATSRLTQPNVASPSSKNSNSSPSSTTSHEIRIFLILLSWIMILSLLSLLPNNTNVTLTKEQKRSIVGITVNCNLVFFYAAPLSTITSVLRTKNSSSLHLPTMVMNTANAFFWCAYSLAISDYYILIPNGLGCLFGAIQLILYKTYPRSQILISNENGHVDETKNTTNDLTENELI